MPTKKNTRRKVVRKRVWVITRDRDNKILFAETTYPNGSFFQGSGIMAAAEEVTARHAIIEFSLPATLRRPK